MKSTLKDGGGKNLLFESTIFTGMIYQIANMEKPLAYVGVIGQKLLVCLCPTKHHHRVA